MRMTIENKLKLEYSLTKHTHTKSHKVCERVQRCACDTCKIPGTAWVEVEVVEAVQASTSIDSTFCEYQCEGQVN